MHHFAFRIRQVAKVALVATGLAFTASVGPAAAQQKLTLAPPVVVTSVGQSLDAFSVQLAVKRAGIDPDYDNHIDDAHIAGSDAKTLFLAVGASVKGFGEAGISIDQEIARTNKLLDAAKKKGMKIVMIHLGGKDRRDDLSDQLIKVVAPRSDMIIVVPGSDDDMLIKGIATKGNIPYSQTASAVTLPDVLKTAFAK